MHGLMQLFMVNFGSFHRRCKIILTFYSLLGHFFVVVWVTIKRHDIHIEVFLVIEVFDITDNFFTFNIICVLLKKLQQLGMYFVYNIFLLHPVFFKSVFVKALSLLPLLFFNPVIDLAPNLQISDSLIEFSDSFHLVFLVSEIRL